MAIRKSMVEVINVEKIRRQLAQQEVKWSRQKLAKGLKAGAEYLKEKSQEVAPVDTGFLRDSAFTKVSPDFLTVTVGYTAPYAVFVHEMPQTWIKVTGKRAKFLEEPARKHKRQIARIVASVAKK